jgi:5-formyltetrahydrofolate cyclo-ligase
VNKSYIRKKILNLRKRNYSKNLLIDSKKFLKFLKKENIKSKIIGGYYPFNYELESLNILEELEKKNYLISLPKVSKNNKMNFFKWSIKDPLKINKYGIPETTSKKKVNPGILLVPLVAFDDKLNRLGYGGGYYDRYISRFQDNHKIIKIGIGFSFQKVKSLPINRFDKKLDFIITEKYSI